MKHRSPSRGHGRLLHDRDEFDSIMDPPSLEDRPTPLPVNRIMVIGDEIDGNEDAPTVAVRDLAELGISEADLRRTAPGARRRTPDRPYKIARPVASFETPESAPIRDMSPEAVRRREATGPTPEGMTPLTMVAAVSVPVVLAACAAVWWLTAV